MSEHKTGKSNWTAEQKARYWQGKQQIAALTADQRRALRRFIKGVGPLVAPAAGVAAADRKAEGK